MAVDQQMNFFRENLPTNNLNSLINNQLYNDEMNISNETFLPFCNLNDLVCYQQQQQKISPAVKDDSGITFNNSALFPPKQQQQTSSRKRAREVISYGLPQQLLTMNPLVTSTLPSTTVSSINMKSKGFSFLGEDLSLLIMQQQLEFDLLISNHMEKMRMEIEEIKKHQLRRVIRAVEESIGRRIREKEEELEKIGKINWALEQKVKSLCVENQIWRDLAQTNEATANALRSNLEQVMQQMKDNVERTTAAEEADDAVSCCGSGGYGGGDVEDGENRWIYRGKSGDGSGRMCSKCGEGESSVLLLPCRHLCLCATCGAAANACPICNTVKNANVYVSLS